LSTILLEQDQAVGYLLLDGRFVDRRQESVALNFSLLLRKPILALARADALEPPDRSLASFCQVFLELVFLAFLGSSGVVPRSIRKPMIPGLSNVDKHLQPPR
jgi:hypothetical protein